jgi:hypothetical protein
MEKTFLLTQWVHVENDRTGYHLSCYNISIHSRVGTYAAVVVVVVKYTV